MINKTGITTVIFDLGGVLIDWNPRYLYRKLFNGDEAAMEDFLANVCTSVWHDNHDRGIGFAENAASLIAKYPDKARLIKTWGDRFEEMFGDSLKETVEILATLREHKTPLYALSNWPAAHFPLAEKKYPFLNWFNGKVVSGFEKITKPDPAIYKTLLNRYNLDPTACVFIDDNAHNIKAAQELGLIGIHFTSPQDLRNRLRSLNLIKPSTPPVRRSFSKGGRGGEEAKSWTCPLASP